MSLRGDTRLSDTAFPWERSLHATAATATTYLAYYNFDTGPSCTEDGWISVDITAALTDFFHVDDFAGLGGGKYGLYTPLEGGQSLWCGARPDPASVSGATLCSYQTLPGYGGGWDQAFCSNDCVDVDTLVTVTFLISWDSEPSFDFTHFEVDNCDGDWVAAGPSLDWRYADSLYTWTIDDALHDSGDKNLRFRFHFTSDDVWSDQDGLWDTDGAVIIDSLIAFDGVGGSNILIPLETFEDESLGATDADDWSSCTPPGYGNFTSLFQGLEALQEDECVQNLSCFIGFYENSTSVYDCVVPSHPEQPTVPFGNSRGQYLHNEYWSPNIPWTGSGNRANLDFLVYRDLPLDNLVFYIWHVRSVDAGGCPANWRDRLFHYSGDEKEWISVSEPFGDLVDPGAISINVAIGAVDMCGVWCGINGTGDCHSHAPLIDNVEVYRYEESGPVFSVRDIDLFNDTFATDGSISPTSTARADGAMDIFSPLNPAILYGDSMRIMVSDPKQGLAADATISGVGVPGSAVYLYLSIWPQGQTAKEGAAVVGHDGDGYAGGEKDDRYPVIGTQVDGDGVTWTCVRFDTAFFYGHDRSGATSGNWCVDINDNLFTTGDTVFFYFSAENDIGDVTYYSRTIGQTHDESEVQSNPMEFTIFPAKGYNNGGDILYVDGMDGRGAQPFFDTALDYMGILEKVDRYDVRGPTSHVGNRPGGRVVNVQNQITDVYRKIIWSTGDLTDGLIGDGTDHPEKSDDAFLLSQFLSNLNTTGGVYLTGDNIASELEGLSGTSVAALKSFIAYTLDTSDHKMIPLGVNPYGVGTDGVGADEGQCFYDGSDPDTLIVYGGCPVKNDFDVISPVSGTSKVEMTYEGLGNFGGAIVSQRTYNGTDTVGVLLAGFSYHYIRDHALGGSGGIDRVQHLYRVITWLRNIVDPYTNAATSRSSYSLAQNYPNPFNPVTTIAYQLKEPGHVTLRVYNVAGQLVRTLLDGDRAAGTEHTVRWDGRSECGERVASGVYLYRLVSGDFVQTRKMVLLK